MVTASDLSGSPIKSIKAIQPIEIQKLVVVNVAPNKHGIASNDEMEQTQDSIIGLFLPNLLTIRPPPKVKTRIRRTY